MEFQAFIKVNYIDSPGNYLLWQKSCEHFMILIRVSIYTYALVKHTVYWDNIIGIDKNSIKFIMKMTQFVL